MPMTIIWLNLCSQLQTLKQGKDWDLHQPHNCSCHAHVTPPSVTVPLPSLYHVHAEVCLTHYANCRLLVTLWRNLTCSKFCLCNMTILSEVLLRQLIYLTALYKLVVYNLLHYLLYKHFTNFLIQWAFAHQCIDRILRHCSLTTQVILLHIKHRHSALEVFLKMICAI